MFEASELVMFRNITMGFKNCIDVMQLMVYENPFKPTSTI